MSESYLDDPRLTAYVLGELEESERVALGAELERDESLQRAVSEIRETVAEMQSTFAAAPANVGLTEVQRDAVLAEGTQTAPARSPRRGAAVAWLASAISVAAVVLIAVQLGERADPQKDSAVTQSDPLEQDRAAGNRAVLAQHDETESEESGAHAKYQYDDRDQAFDASAPNDDLNELRLQFDEQRSAQMKNESQKLEMFGRDLSTANEPDRIILMREKSGDAPSERALPSSKPSSARPSTAAGPQQGDRSGVNRFVTSGKEGSGRGKLDGTGNQAGAAPQGEDQAGGRRNSRPGFSQQSPKKAQPVFESLHDQSTGAAEANPRDETARADIPPSSKAATPGDVGPGKRQTLGVPTEVSGESYSPIVENAFVAPVGENQFSTFSIDVDTASYSNIRRFLNNYQFPPKSAVRIEELVNYFNYDYPQPEGEEPFSVTLEIGACPWNPEHKLVRCGLKGREIDANERPRTNLVFLVDVSGSMRDHNKLPLVKSSLELLAGQMNEDDRIAIVTYSNVAKVHLPSTSGEDQETILSAIRQLKAGGSTNGAGGIQKAYALAEHEHNFLEEGANRVILCTDGDFNVGISDNEALFKMIGEKAKGGVFLSVFGFGMGNLKDSKLEGLADRGNGHYAYIDNNAEARKVFQEEMTSMLYTIAKDVKIQVEFNPLKVGAYRLIGYENRSLAREDFRDDSKDAGEIGAGHTVTALYELVPPENTAGEQTPAERYRTKDSKEPANEATATELLTVRLAYKPPTASKSVERAFHLPAEAMTRAPSTPSMEFEWASAVAAFGMLLRDSQHKGGADYDLVLELALGSRGPDAGGHRREFINLVYSAQAAHARKLGKPVPTPPQIDADLAQRRANVNGKYGRLLKTISVPGDFRRYGQFNEYGFWEGTQYEGHADLPKGHWVYVYPKWYIWGEKE